MPENDFKAELLRRLKAGDDPDKKFFPSPIGLISLNDIAREIEEGTEFGKGIFEMLEDFNTLLSEKTKNR